MIEAKKETEFDSSLECLREIRRLLNQLHDARRGILFFDSLENNIFIVQTLDCVFTEASNKFTQTEIKKCNEIQNSINGLMKKYGAVVYAPFIGRHFNKQPNPQHYEAWANIRAEAKKFELYLMKCMENHNMLLRDKARVESEL